MYRCGGLMQIILRNKWVIDLFTFHSFKGVTNWHATWAKVSLKRVRTPAVEPSLSCADQTRISSLKSDNFNVQSPSRCPTSESREEYQIRDRAMSGLDARGGGFEKVFENSCSRSWLSTGECLLLWLIWRELWRGLHISNPRGWAPLWEAQPTEWMEIILWVAYAYLTYHGCDMFVWAWRGVVRCIGESHKGVPLKNTGH